MKYFILKQYDCDYKNEKIIGIYFTMKSVDEKLAKIYNKDFKYTLCLMQDNKVLNSVGMELAI